MALNPAAPVFPSNLVVLIGDRLKAIDDQIIVHRRPLRMSDGNLTIGIYATEWNPVEGSYEVSGTHPGEPTLQNYTFEVCVGVSDTEEERGLALSSIISSSIRSMLARDSVLKTVLSQVQVTFLGTLERVQRWMITRQRFISAEYQRTFYFMSVLDLVVQTESVPS